MKIFPQSAVNQLGLVLREEIKQPHCQQADFAVAWIRASGLAHMQTALADFLKRGAQMTAVVGVDGDNTSEEALAGLLRITNGSKRAKVFVRHNEAGPIFHPKLYAFRCAQQVRAYIGSNNLTQSGLFQNEEFSVRVCGTKGDALDEGLKAYFRSLTDTASGLSLELTSQSLSELVARGYVKKEALIRGIDRARTTPADRRKPLFGAQPVRPPKLAIAPWAPIQTKGIAPRLTHVREDWHAVQLRLRLARGTQAQIPLEVVREIRRRMGLPGEDGPLELISREDGTRHAVSPAIARGVVNTYKFEVEHVTQEPLLRIFPVGDQLFFEFLDSAQPLGQSVMRLLENGFETDPPSTFSTITDRSRGTWYRFA